MKKYLSLILALLMIVCLCACGGEKAEDAAVAAPAEPATLSGDWYGWWQLTNASGAILEEGFDGNDWDCCASVTGNEITVWDEVSSKTEPLGKLTFSTSDSVTATVQSGFFFLPDVTPSNVSMAISSDVCVNLMTIKGHYDDGEGAFDFVLYLRPWGQVWDDVDETMKPTYSYDDWYLPLLSIGTEAAPEAIEIAH